MSFLETLSALDPCSGLWQQARRWRGWSQACRTSISIRGRTIAPNNGLVFAALAAICLSCGQFSCLAQDIPQLIGNLKHQDPKQRIQAARGLGQLGFRAKGAVASLAQALKDDNPDVRVDVAFALANIAGALNTTGKPLKGDEVGPDAAKAVAALSELLLDDREDARWAGAHALGTFFGSAMPAVPFLQAALSDQSGKVRVVAARAIVQISPDDNNILLVAKLLKDEKAAVRAWVAGDLGFPRAKAAVPALIEALSDSDNKVQQSAATSLGYIGAPAKAAVPALINALADTSVDFRVRAADALGNIGVDAAAAVPALTAMLKEKDAKVHLTVPFALAKMGPSGVKAAVPALISLLQTATGIRLTITVQTLGEIGPEAKEAVPALISLLENPGTRVATAQSLGQIGPNAKAAIPALEKLLSDNTPLVRSVAERALKNIQK